jgi:apolipoprotein N-acyltransferase
VENGVAVVRAANTGVSALVAPAGAIEAELPLGRRGTLAVNVPLRRGTTFYTRAGDVFAYGLCLLSAAALGAACLAGGPR